ncbi:hypothetical protein [Gemmatimonas sp.]
MPLSRLTAAQAETIASLTQQLADAQRVVAVAQRIAAAANVERLDGIVCRIGHVNSAMLVELDDVVSALAPAPEANDFIGEPITAADWHDVAQQKAEQAADLTEQMAAAQTDAARYAWLRARFIGADFGYPKDEHTTRSVLVIDLNDDGPVWGSLDLTVDHRRAAIAPQPSTQRNPSPARGDRERILDMLRNPDERLLEAAGQAYVDARALNTGESHKPVNVNGMTYMHSALLAVADLLDAALAPTEGTADAV